jgi:hypothetical protein
MFMDLSSFYHCHPLTLTPPAQGLVAIYGLYDPRDGEIRYIGKTKNPHQRLNRHWAEKKRRLRRVAWVRSVLAAGVKPQMVILAWVEPEDWSKAERYFIELLTTQGFRLTNLARGGHGSNGWRMSDAQREKVSLRRRGSKLPAFSPQRLEQHRLQSLRMWETRPRTVSAATKQKMSDSRKGIKLPPEWVAASAEGHRGTKRTEETRQRMSEAQLRRWELTGPMPEGTRALLSAASANYLADHPEQQEKMKEGRRRSLYRHSEETRAKQSEAAKRRWAASRAGE